MQGLPLSPQMQLRAQPDQSEGVLTTMVTAVLVAGNAN
jgi:hypothetical protein